MTCLTGRSIAAKLPYGSGDIAPYFLAAVFHKLNSFSEKDFISMFGDKDSRIASAVRMCMLAVAIAIITVAIGCGGSQSSITPPPQQTGTASVHVGVGDSPSDWVMSFTMTINSVKMNPSSGSPVSLLSSPATIEFAHMMGTINPLTMMNVPSGTYTSVTVTCSNAQITYMDPNTRQPVSTTVTPNPSTVTMDFASPVTVGTSPMAMNLDLNLASTVSMPGSAMSVAPSFTANMASMPGTSQQSDFTGAMNNVMGMVSQVSGSSFTMNTMQNGQMTFMTNSSTQFQNMVGMSMMSTGQMVNVDAVTQGDGSMLATSVDSMMNGSDNGMDAAGIIFNVSGAPPTQLQLVMMDGEGSMMSTSQLGGGMTVAVGSSTVYSIDTDGVDMTGMIFTFDANSIALGQNVEADTTGSMMSGSGMMRGSTMMNDGSFTATEVMLEQQGLVGTVSNYSPNGSTATFTLTVPSDSSFASITGATTITVYQQNGTQLRGMSSVANGNTVVVRGLLFHNGGQYSMVSSLIGTP